MLYIGGEVGIQVAARVGESGGCNYIRKDEFCIYAFGVALVFVYFVQYPVGAGQGNVPQEYDSQYCFYI
jgi:hypothetical protein